MDRTPDKSLVWTFPTPNTPLLAVAYRDLYLAAEGTAQQKEMLGDPALLPRPWDPATCQDPLLRQEVWDWLEEFVVWFNREYVWDPNAGMIPSCWPQHPHLVHEIAILADQRHKAGRAIHSDALEEWHRYALPAFFDRRKTRLRTACDSRHHDWPARPAHVRFQDAHEHRARHYTGDVDHRRQLLQPPDQTQQIPRLHVVDGHRVDPLTGEVH